MSLRREDVGWSTEMALAYEAGLADGIDGIRRGLPNDFEGCYEQGWQHGNRYRDFNAGQYSSLSKR